MSLRKLLILDIDHTLICSQLKSPNPSPHDFEIERYYVNKRPYLDTFLDWCFKTFDVGIWTAANEEYATGILLNILREQHKPIFVYTEKECGTERMIIRKGNKRTRYDVTIKNIEKVRWKEWNGRKYQVRDILIVDDTPDTFMWNPGNGIEVKGFYGDSTDDELIYLRKYLESLLHEVEVHRIDKTKWRKKIEENTLKA